MRRLVLIAAVVTAPVRLTAQSGAPITVVKAARMLDLAAGQVVANPVVVVQGNRIVSLGQGSAPKDAKIIDLGDVLREPERRGADPLPSMVGPHIEAGDIGPPRRAPFGRGVGEDEVPDRLVASLDQP